MDFCIADSMDELEKDDVFSDVPFFSKNLVTFIDFATFEEKFLSSYEYNDSGLFTLGVFTLQPKGNIHFLNFLDDSEVKLR